MISQVPRLLFVVSVLLSALPSSARAEDFTGKVIAVADGDTLTVLSGRDQVRIRLHGIDAPEIGQDFGTKAKAAAADLEFGQVVTVRVRDTDRYGRTVADVTLPDGRSLNHELVRGGWAWWYRKYAPDDQQLAKLEAEARAAKRGLWAQPNAIPPWEWQAGASMPPERQLQDRP